MFATDSDYTDEDELREEIEELKRKIEELESPENKRKDAIALLKEFCDSEDNKTFVGGTPRSQTAWEILSLPKPLARWAKMAQFKAWLETPAN